MNHREIEANGISLHFVEEGQGPAVIFAGDPAFWSSWIAEGADGGKNSQRGFYGRPPSTCAN